MPKKRVMLATSTVALTKSSWVEDRAQLYQIDVQTGVAKVLIDLQQPRLNISSYHGRVRLGADGKSVYYVLWRRPAVDKAHRQAESRRWSQRNRVPKPRHVSQWTIALPRRHDARVRRKRRVQDPIWSKDGQRLIFTTYNNPPHKDGKVDIWTVPAAGGQPKSLNLGLHWSFLLDLSPDGRRMVMRDENFNNELWVIKGLFAK